MRLSLDVACYKFFICLIADNKIYVNAKCAPRLGNSLECL